MKKNFPKSALQLVRVTLKDDVWFIGYVVDGALRVLDVVQENRSVAEMTGSWPRMKPIPLDEIRKRGFCCHIEDYSESLPTLIPPDRWPTADEVLQWKM